MSLKTLFFNWGVSKNLLKRCWPLWAFYSLILILVLPMELIGRTRTVTDYSMDTMFNWEVLNSGSVMVYISFVFAAVVAMVMFSYLYNPRSCGMMNSLPIRRETMFTTAFLTGIVPMLILNVLVTGFTAAVCISGSQTEMKYLLLFLAEVSMANIAFYGFAVFCATLTGNIIILPAVYFVLSITAWVAELCTRSLLSSFIYGLPSGSGALNFLSPVVMLASNLSVVSETDSVTMLRIPGAYSVDGLWLLFVYAAVGVLFTGAGLLIYRRRHMESAGDIVAIPLLRPVFRYCMAFGCGVVFAAGMFESFFSYSLLGTAAAAVIALCVCIGAFLGWFIAQMLIKKTVRVFSSGWKQLGILCGVFVLLIALCEYDLFGFERSLPDPAQVKQVMLADSSSFEVKADIERIISLQSRIVSHKEANEAAVAFRTVSIEYFLKNGKTVNRSYRVGADRADIENSGSDIMLTQSLVNLPEAILSRELSLLNTWVVEDCEVTSGNIYVETFVDDEQGYYSGQTLDLTTAQAGELFYQCIYPDLREGLLGRMYLVDCAEAEAYNTTVSLSIKLRKPDGYSDYLGFSVPTCDCRTAKWLKENLDIIPEPYRYYEKYMSPRRQFK